MKFFLIALCFISSAFAANTSNTRHVITLDQLDSGRLQEKIKMGPYNMLLGANGDSDVVIACTKHGSVNEKCTISISFNSSDTWLKLKSGGVLTIDLAKLNKSYFEALDAAFGSDSVHQFKSAEGRLLISCISSDNCFIKARLF